MPLSQDNEILIYDPAVQSITGLFSIRTLYSYIPDYICAAY